MTLTNEHPYRVLNQLNLICYSNSNKFQAIIHKSVATIGEDDGFGRSWSERKEPGRIYQALSRI